MAVISSALGRRARAQAEAQGTPFPPVPVRKALVAAASTIPLDGTGWKSFKLGDTAWQGEAWNHYDICGELRFVANWIGSSVSRCRLYIAELDELGRPGEEVTDPEVAILAETVFGGPAKKAEAMRLLGTHLYVPGESYIVAESAASTAEDRWYVVSTSAIKRQGDREIMVERPQEYGGGWYTLKEGQDLLIRAWTPHPRKYDLADSSVRPALPILREIEQLTKHIFAQIDSRLAGAGLLLLPDQLDFPRGEDDPAGAEGLMKVLQRAMAAALADRADPSSLVPIMAQVPGEFIDKVRHITFETPLAAQGMEIRDRAIRRLGLSLDVDPEILLGKGDTNHWSAWQLEETTIKVHIEPLLARICDAVTTGYLRAALTVLGKDPDAYTFWYDTAPLAIRPNRQEDGLALFDADALSEEALRTAGAWSEDDAPDDAERARRLATKLVLASPDLIREKAIREALGVAWDIEPAQQPPALGPGQEPGQQEAQPGAGERSPERARERTPARERALPKEPQQNDGGAQAAALMTGAHMVVMRSLEMAGKRLLTRANRDKYRDVPPWELHTAIHVLEPEHAERLLEDTFATVPMLAERTGVPADELRTALAAYCKELFVRAVPHDYATLEEYLGWCLEEAHQDELEAWMEDTAAQFHLPGLHDQKNHGRKRGRPGFEPFTPEEKRKRAAERRQRIDPDRDAPAPDRQGKRAFAAWESEARVLNGRFQRQLREENAKVGLPEPKAKEPTAKEREWADREAKMRDDLAKMLAVMMTELKGNKDLPEMLKSMTESTENRIQAAKALFFGDNPEVLTEAPGTGFHWYERLNRDTDWDSPVPIKDLRISGVKVQNGFAWRRNGVMYAVQVGLDDKDPGHARQVAQRLAEMHDSNLPGDASKFQKGYFWTSQESPGNDYWQKRFNNPNHRAAASAGDGAVSFWSKTPAYLPGPTEEGHIVHEYGHNVDQTSTTGGRISKSVEWQFAMYDDFAGNPGKKGPAKSRVVEFLEDKRPGQHPIKFSEGHGKEAPYGVTTYGQSSLAEDLAESIRLYQQGHVGTGIVKGSGVDTHVNVWFRDLFPERAKILDKEFPELARQQKAAIRAERAQAKRDEERNRKIDADRVARGLRPSY